METIKMTKFLSSLKAQLADLNSRNPENNSKVGFGFTDFLSPDDEIKIISDILKVINSSGSFKEYESAYKVR